MRYLLFFICIIFLFNNANANSVYKVKNINDIEWKQHDWKDSTHPSAKDKVVWCVTPQGTLSPCYGGTKKLKLEQADGNYFYLKSGNSCLRAGNNSFDLRKCKKNDDFLFEQVIVEQRGGTFRNGYDILAEGYVRVVFKIKNSNKYIGAVKFNFIKVNDISDAYFKDIYSIDIGPCLKDSIKNLQGEEKVFCTCSFSSTFGLSEPDYNNFLELYPKIKAKLKKDVYYPLACLDAVEAYRELGTMVAEATTKSDTKVHTKTYSRGVYTGELKNGKMNGKGMFKYNNGGVYKGEWKNGVRHRGIMINKDGSKYDGEFKNDKYHGQGEYVYTSGQKYIGEFKFGKSDGFGTLYKSDGTIIKGFWEKDKFLKNKQTASNKNETPKITKTQNETTKIISNKTSNSLDEKGYADCILENMKNVSSDAAAKAIKDACTYKYLSDNNNSNVISSSADNTSAYSDNTIGIVSLPSNLSSCGSITTTRFPIFTGC